ncbi:DNA-binding response regulator, partial [Clostridium botulinum]|nr:DNA-binding response regulator [Clostridium botulinum]
LKGQRELILFLYRYWLCYFTEDTQKALEDILELNNQFVLPLSKTEVIRATRSAERVFLSKDKRYKYKNKTLIDLLEIIELEETYMKTIISDKEYKRRQNNAFRKRYQEKLKLDGKLTKKEQINIQRQKIKALLEQGFTQKDISKELNIPSRTIERRVKELRTLQEIV